MMSSLKLFLILYYIKQIHVDSKLLCICSVIDHRWCQNVVRTSVTHSTAPCVPLFCSYHILMSSVIYYWTDTQQLGIYLLNRFHITMWLLSNQSQMMSELWWEWKKAHKMQPSVTLMFIQHFDIICDVILYRPTATCNLFVLYD